MVERNVEIRTSVEEIKTDSGDICASDGMWLFFFSVSVANTI
jgi:hypothetical protein